ncbi:MAG: methyltransferase domain-containing protein [Acidobacteriota bacterium]
MSLGSRSKSLDLYSEVSASQVTALGEAIPDFPERAVKVSFKEAGVACNEEIPREFSKFFAVMSALAAGDLHGKRLLDVGTGLGVLVAQAKCMGMIATGTDTFTEYESTCRSGALCIFEAYGHSREEAERSFLHHDITEGPVPDRYDFVTSIGMMEHIYGDETRKVAIDNMMKSVAPGGSLILACGPNQYFPIDFFHYGPRFVFYHNLPLRGRRAYLRAFAGPAACHDARWLDGMRVAEIRRHILESEPEAEVRQLFPLWVRASNSPWLRSRLVRAAAETAARVLSAINAEPVIILVASRPVTK